MESGNFRWPGLAGVALAAATLLATPVAAQDPPPAPLQIIPRAEWADRAPQTERMKKHKPALVTIHHAGVQDDGTIDGHEKMRRLLRFSLDEKPWGDMPYHFVIDRKGQTFAGRALQYAPDTNTGYDVEGHIGICVNGDLTQQPLLESQYRALLAVLAHVVSKFQIGHKQIAGHMDYSPTACPGSLEHYIRDGTLLADLRAQRNSQPIVFQLKPYDVDLLTEQSPGTAASSP